MTPILGITASSITPFTLGDFESIATVTVGAGGSSSISFSSIPSTFKHLQIRMSAIKGTALDYFIRFNSDSGANYTRHRLTGSGSAVAASGVTGQNQILMLGSAGLATSPIPNVAVIDVLDYQNSNKYKTVRVLNGQDSNGSGGIEFLSGLWLNTNAISSILIDGDGGSFAQHSHFALYGIK